MALIPLEYFPRRPLYTAVIFDGDVEALQAWIDSFGFSVPDPTGNSSWMEYPVSYSEADGLRIQMINRWGDGPNQYEHWGAMRGELGDYVSYYNTAFGVQDPETFNAFFEPATP